MIFELRVYEILPGQMDEMHKRFRDHLMPLFKKHGIEVVLVGVPEIGDMSNHFTYVARFADLGDRERSWESFHTDQDRLAYRSNVGPVDPVVRRFRSTILKAADYSPSNE